MNHRADKFLLTLIALIALWSHHQTGFAGARSVDAANARWSIQSALSTSSAPLINMESPSAVPAQATDDQPAPAKSAKARKAEVKKQIETGQASGLKASDTPGLASQAIGLSLLAIVPFVMMLVTPFAKFAMVFSLLRNALGVQQVPPNQVVNGVALILSLFVMFPVGLQMYEKATDFMTVEPPPALSSDQMPQYILKIVNTCKEPMRFYLQKNTDPQHIKNFFKIAYRMSTEERYRTLLQNEDFIVLVPAFITTQVKRGFEIGTLIFLPFFVVDLVVSNILLAMGMMMLSPVTISMPLKIFLLVMLDGWTLLTEGLISSYK